MNDNVELVFAIPLDDLSHYNVTIISEPQSPIQPHSVINGSGQINGSDVNAVAINFQPGDDLIDRDDFDWLVLS